MTVEAATFVGELVDVNPAGSDPKSQGDNHLRLIKAALRNTFPRSDFPFAFPAIDAIDSTLSVQASDLNKTFLMDTSGGAFQATLPADVDAGWYCYFMKVGSGVNPFFIAPPSGTLQSGDLTELARTRRAIPGKRCRAIWTGSIWFVERAIDAPVGSIIDFSGSVLPAGFEWPNGQTLSSASTNYPDFFKRNGNSGVTIEHRGRTSVGRDNMGSDAEVLDGIDFDSGNRTTIGSLFGALLVALGIAHMPEHNHSSGSLATNTTGNHSHPITTRNGISIDHQHSQSGRPAGEPTISNSNGTANTQSAGAHSHNISGNTGNRGDGEAHINVQPSIIMNKLLVVE